jgi:hypothetical protein
MRVVRLGMTNISSVCQNSLRGLFRSGAPQYPATPGSRDERTLGCCCASGRLEAFGRTGHASVVFSGVGDKRLSNKDLLVLTLPQAVARSIS